MFTEVIWLVDDPDAEIRTWWESEYPAITDRAGVDEQVHAAGFETVASFVLPRSAWTEEYYEPMADRASALRERLPDDPVALEKLRKVIAQDVQRLDRLITDGVEARRAVDIGCGTAVLAMAAASVWSHPVLASDIDAQAVEVAVANLRANDMQDRVQVVEAAGFDHADLAGPFDLIFANILKGPLIALAGDLTERLAPGGHAILSGILNDQAQSVIDVYIQNGNSLVHHDQIGDWSTLTLRKLA